MPLETREQRLAAIANGPKPNCLFLDFGGLVRRHGPIDMVTPKRPGKGTGDAPVKTCPPDKGGCSSLVHASVMECPDCGYEWERQLSDKITKSAAVTPILSKSESIWRKVDERRFSRHEKFQAAASLKVEYKCGPAVFPEWIPFENEKGKFIAERWWRQGGGQEPVPEDVSEALKRVSELKSIEEVRIEADGKFWRITGRRFGGEAPNAVEGIDLVAAQIAAKICMVISENKGCVPEIVMRQEVAKRTGFSDKEIMDCLGKMVDSLLLKYEYNEAMNRIDIRDNEPGNKIRKSGNLAGLRKFG